MLQAVLPAGGESRDTRVARAWSAGGRAPLPERELPVTAGGDFRGLAAVMHAIAVVAQHAAHGAAVHVAVHAGLPGIDLAGEEPLGRLDDRLRPFRHVLGPGFHA